MTEWAVIEPRFTRLRDFVLNDLDRFVAQDHGGNFAVVGLVMAACDALGGLRYGGDSGDKILERCLPDVWKPAAPVLYDALRHGLLHGYDAQFIRDGGSMMGFEIAWRGEEHHLEFRSEHRTSLFVSATGLVRGLREAFDSVEQELRADRTLRDQFSTRDRRDREIHIASLSAARALAWREAVAATPVMPAPWQRGTLAGATGPILPPSDTTGT